MRKITNSKNATSRLSRWLLTAVVLLGITTTETMAQCAQYTANVACTTAAPTVVGNSISCTPPSNNGGRRNFVVTGMVAGNTYRVGNCGSGFDTQITIFNGLGGTSVAYNDDNGPACVGAAASMDFIPSASGTYYIQLSRYNCSTIIQTSGTITVTLLTAGCTQPTTQATIGAYTNNTTGTSITANWTRGNGTAGVIVVARLTATASVSPAGGTTYTANTAFGAGTGSQITGAGNYVVYVGTGTTVNVTGLAMGTGYTFEVYEYNTASVCYKVPSSSSAVTTFSYPAVNVPATGNNSVACGTSSMIYDNGGAGGVYSINMDGYTVLNNQGTGVITLSGTYSGIETCCDYIQIYSGVGTGGTMLAQYGSLGSGTITTVVSAAGQPLTIRFYSDVSVTGNGFALQAVYSGSCALAAPTVTSFTPTSGCASVTPVTITGTNFTGATAVQFGGVNAASFTVVNSTTITATPAATASGTVSVVTSGGTGTSAGTFTINAYPVITVQPTAPAAFCGGAGTATASVTATGATTYAWYRNGVALTNTAPYSNVTTNTITITNPTSGENGASLTCVISNGSSCTVTTTGVSIIVGTAPAAPTSVTATASSICVGQSSNLNATSAGNNINWWNAATGGTLLTTVGTGVNYSVSPTVTTTYYAETNTGTAVSQTFAYSGSIVNFTVPAGVTSLHVTAIGATGGNTSGYTPVGGAGAKMVGDITVTPGQVLKVLVGGAGVQGTTSSGGGGGGGSFVTSSTNTPLVIAGGGGGVAVSTSVYTPVGADAVTATSGVNGYSGLGGSPLNYGLGGVAGSGATTFSGGSGACGGNGGGLLTNGQANASCCPNTYAYAFVNGGAGGTVCTATGNGGFGGGGGGGNTAGGGGGGYSGGGASWNNPTNGGGGGSYNSGTNQVNTAGFNTTGNGSVVITWNVGGCLSATRVPVTVTVNATPTVAVTPTSSNYCNPGTAVSLTASGANSYSWLPSTGLSGTTGSSVSASPSSATTYTVTGTGSNGCTATATTTITPITGVTISSVTATPAAVCTGGSSALTVVASGLPSNTAAGYSFSTTTGNTLVTLTSPTNLVGLSLDDAASAVTPIGFSFNFAGTTYTQFSASSNGQVNLGAAGVSTAYSNATSGASFPSLMPLWDDLQTGSDFGVNYQVIGNAPNRQLVIDFKTNTCCPGTPATQFFQVWLFETTNLIKFVYGANSTTPGSFSCGIATSGAVYNDVNTSTNTNSTVAYQDVNSVWPGSGRAYIFAPPTPTYSWGPSTFLGGVTTGATVNATAITSATTYTVTATATNGCTNTGTVSVSLNPVPVGSASNQTICSGFASGVTLGSTIGSTTFTWTAGLIGATTVTGFSNCVTGACTTGGVIAQTLTNTSNSQQGDVRYTVIPTSPLGCVGSSFITDVFVNPKPVGSTSGNELLCSGDMTSLGLNATTSGSSTFTWTVTPSSVNITGASACSSLCGSTIAQTLSNSGTTTGTVLYTIIPTSAVGCVGNSFTARDTVGATPVGSATSPLNICNGGPSNIPLFSTVTGTEFTWTSAVTAGSVIGNQDCPGGCSTTISDVLTALVDTGSVQYTISPVSAIGCPGADFTVDVNITQPSVAPTSLNGNSITCNGSSVTITQSGGSLGTGAYWQWYTYPSYGPAYAIGGQLTSSDAALTVSPTAVTTYYLRAEGTTSPCAANATGPGGLVVHVTTAGSWIGVTSSDWFDASNWCGGVPTSTTNAVIINTAVNMPVINAPGAVCRNLTINSGTSLTMTSTGELTLFGNWNNNGTFTPGDGMVTFGAAIAQTLGGGATNTFDNLYTNNSSATGLTINSNVMVTNLLQMDNGNVRTGSNTMTLDTNAFAIPTGGFVIGNLKAYFPVGAGASVTYPIGTGTSYAPIDVFVDSVTVGGWITATTAAGDHANIATSAFNPSLTVNRTWTLTNNNVTMDFTGGNAYSVGLQYAPADVDAGLIEANEQVQQYTGGAWGAALSGVNSFGYEFVNGLTTFGDFQIGQINPTPSLYSINPTQGTQGQTLNVDFNGGGFISGSSTVNVGGADITVNTTTVSGDTLITANITIASNATLGARNFTVTNAGPGGGTSTAEVFTVVSPLPVADFLSNTVVIPCNTSGTAQFSNYSTNATTYSWNFGAGASPQTATGFGPFTVSYGTTGLKTITLIASNATNSDTLTRTNYISVSNVGPVMPSYITGPLGLCGLIGTNVTYTCPLVNGASSYDWTIPSGASLVSGQGTTALTVVFNNGFTTGNISVHSTNGCGSSADKTISVSFPPPAILGIISGPDVVCGVTSAVYSINPVPGATSYTWTVPTGINGMTITSGQGTNSIHVSITAGTVIGYVTVYATGTCGNSVIDSLKVTKKPEVHGAISGPAVACGMTTASYSIASVFGATSYAWTVPSGMTVATGAGTDSITVTIGPSFVTGQVKVSAVNACGNIPGVELTVVGRAPNTPVSLSGPTNICGLTTATYTVPSVLGASRYFWSLPSGMTINGAAGGNSINVNISGYTTGNISVVSHDTCGNSLPRTLILTAVAVQPGAITGPTSICGVTTASYSVVALSGSYTYNWSLTLTGWSITSGQGTNSITVSGPATGTSSSGLVRVSATNTCGSTSALRTMAVTYCHDGIAMNNTETNSNTFSNIYPNPATSEFTIDVTSDVDKDVTVEVYDVLGNLVINSKHQLVAGTNTMKTNIEEFKNGMYFVRLLDVDSNVIHSQTVIKQ